MALRILICIIAYGFAACKPSKLSTVMDDISKNSDAAQASKESTAADRSYAYWIVNNTAHRGYCPSTGEPVELRGNLDRSRCQVTHKLPIAEFEANLEKNFLTFTGQASMSATDRMTMKGGLAAITEDLDLADFEVPPIDPQKLDEIIVKYLGAIEAAIGVASEVKELAEPTGLSLLQNQGISPQLVINRQIGVPFGRVLYSQRYQLPSNVRTEALAVQMKGGRCGAHVTGLTVSDNMGNTEFMVHRGAGIFTPSSGMPLNASQFQFTFSQESFLWGSCQIEAVQLQDYRSQIPNINPLHSGANAGIGGIANFSNNSFRGQMVGTYNFNGGLALQAFVPFQQTPVRVITIDNRACPNARITAVRTTPIGQCSATLVPGTNNSFVPNDCRHQGGGSGANINGISFAVMGGFGYCQMPVYVQ